MGKRVGIEVSLMVSEAVKACNVDVVSAYPITPQTHIVEELSQMVADGDLDAEFIRVESEHSAMAACTGAAAVGARTFTSTASQGLQLMSEIVHATSGLRLPVVMAVANRSLAAPLSIWGDHTDIMANRDTGWIMYFVEDGQSTHDHIFMAYRVAENKDVLLPVMVNLDGFFLTHVIEPVEIIEAEELGDYLPPFEPMIRLNPRKPVTMGPASTPGMYTEAKKAQEEALVNSRPIIDEAWEEFGKRFGRHYKAVETYKTDDAELVIVIMGSLAGNARQAVDAMRNEGRKVGLAYLRLFRPFPEEDLRRELSGASVVAVCDRAIAYGAPAGPLCGEIKDVFYGYPDAPYIANFVLGLAGRDVRVNDFRQLTSRAEEMAATEQPARYEIIGLRE